jgi:hypothetical protein
MTKYLKLSTLALVTCLFFQPGRALSQNSGDFALAYGFNYTGQARRENAVAPKEKGPGSFKFWLHPRLFLYVQSDTFKSSKLSGAMRTTGVGDTVTGLDFTLLNENSQKKTPEIDLDYSAKLPTASRGLGSGQVDHQIYAAFVRSFGRFSLELDAGDYIAGLPQGGSAHSAILTLVEEAGLGHPSKSGEYKWKWSNEIDGASAAGGDPSEAYDLSSLTYKLAPRVSLVSGVRVGLTPFTPKFGAYFSLKFKGSLRRSR